MCVCHHTHTPTLSLTHTTPQRVVQWRSLSDRTGGNEGRIRGKLLVSVYWEPTLSDLASLKTAETWTCVCSMVHTDGKPVCDVCGTSKLKALSTIEEESSYAPQTVNHPYTTPTADYSYTTPTVDQGIMPTRVDAVYSNSTGSLADAMPPPPAFDSTHTVGEGGDEPPPPAFSHSNAV
jgi:hypothetical protein